MSDLMNINSNQLPEDMRKISFSENFIKMLFAKYREIKPEYIWDFLHKAQASGANPVTGQIMLTPRKVKLKGSRDQYETVGVVVYSYGYTLGIVQQHPDYQGMNTKIEIKERIVFPRRFVVDKWGNEKEILDINSEPTLKKELCAVTTIIRKGTHYEYVAYLSDYFAENNPQWKQMPETMLRKCCEVACARHAFADCVQGFYTSEEFDRDENAEQHTISVVENLAEEKKIEKNLEIQEKSSEKVDYDKKSRTFKKSC